jgi:hypothetical protein
MAMILPEFVEGNANEADFIGTTVTHCRAEIKSL